MPRRPSATSKVDSAGRWNSAGYGSGAVRAAVLGRWRGNAC